MAYDEDLAERIRLLLGETLLGETATVSERKMFGGLAFMVDRHMTVVVSGQGGIMSRIDPADANELVTNTPARLAVMKDREMPGWVRVADDDVRTDEELKSWIDRAVAFSATLPRKS